MTDRSFVDLQVLADRLGVTMKAENLPGDKRSPGELLALGWAYRDVPWCSAEFWAKLWEVMGEGNYKMLARTQRGDDTRGQALISPEGMERMRGYSAAHKAASNAGKA